MTKKVSAFIRLKNESQTLNASLASISGIFDDYLFAIQPSYDDTFKIVHDFAKEHNCQIIHYPLDSWPNGPGYSKQDPTHPESRTYFYNFSARLLKSEYACKWDGDMIAGENFASFIQKFKKSSKNYASFRGIECSDGKCETLNARVYTANEVRIFPVRKKNNFYNGEYCEKHISYKGIEKYRRYLSEIMVDEPLFYHFKYAKDEPSRTKAWPSDWREQPHFLELANTKNVVNDTCLLPLKSSILQ